MSESAVLPKLLPPRRVEQDAPPPEPAPSPPRRRVVSPERDLPLSDSTLRALWRLVEVGVFVVLIVKDRKLPTWNAPPTPVTPTVVGLRPRQ